MDESQSEDKRAPESAGAPPPEAPVPPAEKPTAAAFPEVGRSPNRHHTGIGGAVFGIWIVVIGVLFLLQNLGLFDIGDIWRFWPLILIGFGISRIVGSYHPGGRVWGAFMALLGGVLLATNLGWVTHSIWRYIWPLALVFWGITIIMGQSWKRRFLARRGFDQRGFDGRGFSPRGFDPRGFNAGKFDRQEFRRQRYERKQWERAVRHGQPWPPPGDSPAGPANPGDNTSNTTRDTTFNITRDTTSNTTSNTTREPSEEFAAGGFHASTSSAANRLHEYAILGGVRRRIDSQEFEGGDATAVLGGIELDLSAAATQLDEVVIEANAFMGGVDLRVPQNWDITVQGMGILGGYNDSTRQFAPTPGAPKRPHLIITGQAMFGGVNVKN